MQYPIIKKENLPEVLKLAKEMIADIEAYQEACQHPENFELVRFSYPIEYYHEDMAQSVWELQKLLNETVEIGEI